MTRTFSVTTLLVLWCFFATGRSPAAVPPVLAEALAGPMKHVDQIVFAVRLPYDDPHWYANIGYYCDDEHRKAYAGNGKPDAGRLSADRRWRRCPRWSASFSFPR